MSSDLVVIANAARAQLLRRDSSTEALQPLAGLEHAESRLRPGELGDDRPGHGAQDQRRGGIAFAPRSDERRKQHLRFADELSQRIDELLAAQAWRDVLLFASSPFLGELKRRLGAPARDKLRAAFDLDLTSFEGHELQRRVEHALNPPAAR